MVDAAGARAEAVGAMGGAAPIGLVAKRRTAIAIDAPAGMPVDGLPCINFVAGDADIKPDAGRLMASPGDKTPDAAQHVRPDEMDIAVLAVLADRSGRETRIEMCRIVHSWAGLRSFVPDEGPVTARDPHVEGLIRNAGRGGYFIMMARAPARAAAALCLGDGIPGDFAASGRDWASLAAARGTRPARRRVARRMPRASTARALPMARLRRRPGGARSATAAPARWSSS